MSFGESPPTLAGSTPRLPGSGGCGVIGKSGGDSNSTLGGLLDSSGTRGGVMGKGVGA